VADASLPIAGRGQVRVLVLATSVQYADVLIRRHLYPQTMHRRPPFLMGYDVVGEIDQLGEWRERQSGWRPRGRYDGGRVERRLSHAPG
jgi:NADPH:quinone reductase-like Zn-dependent oxidoreductase